MLIAQTASFSAAAAAVWYAHSLATGILQALADRPWVAAALPAPPGGGGGVCSASTPTPPHLPSRPPFSGLMQACMYTNNMMPYAQWKETLLLRMC